MDALSSLISNHPLRNRGLNTSSNERLIHTMDNWNKAMAVTGIMIK
jgi:hypothetical protein